MIKILYLSNLCSENVFAYLFKTSNQRPEQAAQKFHKLLVNGFSFHTDRCSTETLSSLPVVPSNHNRKVWNLSTETINNIKFNYIPILNVTYIKNLGVFIYTFFKVFFWSLLRFRQRKVVLCDVLNVTTATASLIACKITATKNVAIVMDMPNLMVTNLKEQSTLKSFLFQKIVQLILVRFSGYILLTNQMNQKVNPKNKPYIIMEGLVDKEMKGKENKLDQKAQELILIYAGGLYEKYGVKTLIDAFMKLDNPITRLHLYGSGEMVKDMPTYMKSDSRIVYKGIVPNKTVVQDQLRATLLINPRPTSEEFTKFSFPSKNMEYMVSGTPMITTKLPGMPCEYWDYVYLFEDESVNGMYGSLENILSKSRLELHQFGLKSKEFVIKNKNNQKQAARVLEFYKNNLN